LQRVSSILRQSRLNQKIKIPFGKTGFLYRL